MLWRNIKTSRCNLSKSLAIYIASSNGSIIALSVLYGSSLMALLLVAWPWWLSVILVVPLLFDYWQVLRIYGLRNHRNAVSVITKDCEQWVIQLFSGTQLRGRISKQKSYYSAGILILFISDKYYGKYVLIPRDSISIHNYRFLAQQISNSI